LEAIIQLCENLGFCAGLIDCTAVDDEVVSMMMNYDDAVYCDDVHHLIFFTTGLLLFLVCGLGWVWVDDMDPWTTMG